VKDRELYFERLKMVFDCSKKELEEMDRYFQMQALSRAKKQGVK
jgi:hypothetical protein